MNTASVSWSPIECMKVKAISDVQIAPDHRTVLFVATEASLEKNSYISRIYKSSEGNSVVFTPGDHSCTQPRWSPGGEWVAFASVRSGVQQLCVISASGKEEIQLTSAKQGVQTFRWSPDGRQIAFVRADEEPIREPILYKEGGAPSRLWVVDIASKEARALTDDPYFVRGLGDLGTKNEEFDWSLDGKAIVFSYMPGPGLDHFHLDARLASVDLASGRTTEWEPKSTYEAMPRFSPDGKWVAYATGDGEATYAYDRYVAIRSADGTYQRRLAATFNEGPFLGGPHLLGWTADGTHVLYFEPKRTKFHIVMLPLDGSRAIELPTSDLYFDVPSLSQDRTMIGMTVQSSSRPAEAYVSSLFPFAPRGVSRINADFLAKPMPKTDVISWSSKDGLEIEGLLTYPIGYEKGKRYPLLLAIHGGPMGFFRDHFLGNPYCYPYARFAELGYFILRPNPRGSTGYGKSFRSANFNDFGGNDYADLIAGVDHLISDGVADADKLGIMGWSYGGYLTAWAISQTNRFKAASVGAAPINLISMAGTTDLHRLISDCLGDFNQNLEVYLNRSPLFKAANVDTPCLIQHGIKDLRVPVSQAHELYHALKAAGKNPVLALYPHTTHYFEKPAMELDSMERNLKWFQMHLGNSSCSI